MDLADRLTHLATQRDLLDVMVARQYTPYADRAWCSGLDSSLLLQMYVLDPDPVQHAAKFLRLWQPPYGAHVLDCGCGTGRFAALLQAQRPDLHWTLLGHNTDQLTHAARVAPCCQGDMHALPFAPGTFDAVLLAYALGYVYAPTVLGEVAQALKPGGQCVLWDMLAPNRFPADHVLVSLGYKCYVFQQLNRYAMDAGLHQKSLFHRELHDDMANADLNPYLADTDKTLLQHIEDETFPITIIWENVGTAKDIAYDAA